MIVECPNCTAKFNLPDAAFKEGAKARCSQCKHVFPLAADTESSKGHDFSDGKDASATGTPPVGADTASPDDEDGFEVSDEPLNYNLDDIRGAEPEKVSKEKTKKASGKKANKALVFIFVFLLLVGGALGAVYYFAPQYLSYIPFLSSAEPEPTEDPALEAERLRNMALKNVQQYYISNEQVGSLVVIDGWVQNNFESPKDLIKVQATLFDSQGAVVDEQVRLAGNKLSLFQLQTLTPEEIENELANKVGILTNNTNIPPGGETPFMVVFPAAADTVTEFEVRVVQVKDPPE